MAESSATRVSWIRAWVKMKRPTERGSSSIDPRREGLLEDGEQALLAEIVGEGGELLDAELAAEHRGRAQDLLAALREALEAAADDLPHAVGDAHAPVLPGRQPLGREGTLLDEQAHDLGHEERVALGVAVDGRDQGVGRRDAGRAGDEAADVLGVEAAAAGPARRGAPASARRGWRRGDGPS